MHTLPLRTIGSLVAAAAIAALTAGAATAAPAAGGYVATQYKPKTRRDFTGLWENTQGIAWAPRPRGTPPVPPPLTPEYQAIFAKATKDAAEGKPTGDLTAGCLPQGMPRIMTMTYPMEVIMNDIQVNIFAEWQEQTRRIFIDGRLLPAKEDIDPSFYGHSVGHWEGDVLVAETIGLRGDTNLEATGLPHSEQLTVKERIWLENDNELRDEITLIDPKAYTRPWTVTKIYKRMEAGSTLLPYVCLENQRNPVDDKGVIGFVHEGGSDKP